MFRGKFFIDAVLPEPHPDGYEAVTMTLAVSIPFLPSPGLMLSLVKDGDYFKVDDVYWSAEAPGAVEVFLEEAANIEHGIEYFEAQGWVRDEP